MLKKLDKKLSVAPMMDWTDRHCRYFHRQLSREVLLYSEMVTAAAIVHGDAERLLGFDAAEHPVALQLGGSDPEQLAAAVTIANEFGYDEINFNVGCPSDRVQSGCFGAALMATPALVAECVVAMKEASRGAEITVKCRIGIDDQIPRDILPDFLQTVANVGVTSFAIHARKAWLEGLSPKQNRDVPPLDVQLVLDMKRMFPALEVVINGGITSLDQALGFLDQGLDGVMIGRAAYHDPAILLEADRRIFGVKRQISAQQAVIDMLPYIDAHLNAGGRLNQISRHMLGLFAGRVGARKWRRILSEGAHLDGAGPALILEALAAVSPDQGLQSAPQL
ncbi:MAG: tRNA dihydrouridine(20/20a) synthase DusA [Alphaproteobacteria bacterium]|nr:tRNA dihydrouridine(20/20a) synthase DusA [Alphaproteobacteria bacterium]